MSSPIELLVEELENELKILLIDVESVRHGGIRDSIELKILSIKSRIERAKA